MLSSHINTATAIRIEKDLFHFGQFSSGVLVVAQVLFITHQDDWNIWTEVFNLRCPLLRNILYKVNRDWVELLETYINKKVTKYNV